MLLLGRFNVERNNPSVWGIVVGHEKEPCVDVVNVIKVTDPLVNDRSELDLSLDVMQI